VAYDKADWHYGGDYPEGIPPENGGTHIGMFLAWAFHRGLAGELLVNEAGEELEAVIFRRKTGRSFLFEVCDEKFWEDDLSPEGNAFAQAYYETDIYIQDYQRAVGAGLPSLYHVEDTWENFERVCKVVDERHLRWKENRGRPWWKFWKPRI
jgi:hypothetical protein